MKMYNKPITDVLTLGVTSSLMTGSPTEGPGGRTEGDNRGDNPFGAPRHL